MSNVVIAVATVAGVLVTAVYAFFTWRLWHATKQQAETSEKLAIVAERQADATQKLLEMGECPYVSVDVYPDAGTSSDALRLLVVLSNHGRVPANIEYGRMAILVDGREIQTEERRPTFVACPQRSVNLAWNFTASDAWPARGAWMSIATQIQYRGAFARSYETKVASRYPRPEVHTTQLASTPLLTDRSEAT